MARRDWIGAAATAAFLAALLLYRAAYVEPRIWGALCAAAAPPLACVPRGALLWLQNWDLWGWGALLLGLWAFMGGPFAVVVAAVIVGAAGVANYNATFGMVGLALGAWTWLTAPARRAATGIGAAGARPAAGRRPTRSSPAGSPPPR